MESFYNNLINCEAILSHSIKKKYVKNQIIFNQGDLCNNLAIIIKGCIEIVTYTSTSKQFSIAILEKENTFGELLIFNDKTSTYLGNVIAIKETELILISKKDFLRILKENTNLLLSFINTISKRALDYQQRSKILLQKTIRDKILFYLEEKYEETENEFIKIQSKEKLAKYLNIPRPSLSRELINLKKDKLIDYSKNFIKYNRSKI